MDATLARIAGLLFVALAAGCAGPQRVKPAEPAATGATPGAGASEPAPPPVASAQEPSRAQATVPPDSKAPASKAPARKAAAKAPAHTTAAGPRPPKKESPAPAAAKPQAPPQLDLKSLEARLKDTPAIGVFTKITLKNQVDDLLQQFRAYYRGELKIGLAELRRSYEGLLLKVLALLQDADPPLASDIVAS